MSWLEMFGVNKSRVLYKVSFLFSATCLSQYRHEMTVHEHVDECS